jgi:hypothetical protein
LAALLFLLGVGGCVSAGAGRTSGAAAVDPDRISEEELAADPGQDLLTIIESLRPRWLRPRGRTFTGVAPVAVVVDGVPWQGGVGNLRSIRASDVRELRYLSAADATTQFGSDMAGGAIVVYRKR